MPEFTLCPVPDNKKAMFSFTFDDGTKDHLAAAAPELEKRGWHGTFFINSLSNDRIPSARLSGDGIRELSQRGHEIALHTMTHRKMDDLDQAGQTTGNLYGTLLRDTGLSEKHPPSEKHSGNSATRRHWKLDNAGTDQ